MEKTGASLTVNTTLGSYVITKTDKNDEFTVKGDDTNKNSKEYLMTLIKNKGDIIDVHLKRIRRADSFKNKIVHIWKNKTDRDQLLDSIVTRHTESKHNTSTDKKSNLDFASKEIKYFLLNGPEFHKCDLSDTVVTIGSQKYIILGVPKNETEQTTYVCESNKEFYHLTLEKIINNTNTEETLPSLSKIFTKYGNDF